MSNNELKGHFGGAWNENAHMTLYPNNFNFGLAEFIVDKLAPTNLLEFGSGLGYLSKHITDKLKLNRSLCIEPNEIKGCYDNTNGPCLIPIDIFSQQHPYIINEKFDIVISIEVAEHINRERHDYLFDFLVSHASNWIVFSGARIGQGGHGHIAERSEEDWKDEFLKRGMIFEEPLTSDIRQSSDEKNINHRKNVMIFRRPTEYEALDTIEQHAKPYLRDILTIVQAKVSYLDGNLFYVDLQDAKNAMPVDCLKEKRLNLIKLAKTKKNILEIGFNAGHSALLMLLASNDSHITVIDTCQHPYTLDCYRYLRSVFPFRLTLIQGDSSDILSTLKDKSFDLIHYDGGKEKTIENDLYESRRLVTYDHILVIDDSQNQKLKMIILDLASKGIIDLTRYKGISNRTKEYKWTHEIAVFID